MASMPGAVVTNGDLNNTSAVRDIDGIKVDLAYSHRSLALKEDEDDKTIRKKYRPFIPEPHVTLRDWISELELSTVIKLAEENIRESGERLKVLVLYGSLRER